MFIHVLTAFQASLAGLNAFLGLRNVSSELGQVFKRGQSPHDIAQLLCFSKPIFCSKVAQKVKILLEVAGLAGTAKNGSKFSEHNKDRPSFIVLLLLFGHLILRRNKKQTAVIN